MNMAATAGTSSEVEIYSPNLRVSCAPYNPWTLSFMSRFHLPLVDNNPKSLPTTWTLSWTLTVSIGCGWKASCKCWYIDTMRTRDSSFKIRHILFLLILGYWFDKSINSQEYLQVKVFKLYFGNWCQITIVWACRQPPTHFVSPSNQPSPLLRQVVLVRLNANPVRIQSVAS